MTEKRYVYLAGPILGMTEIQAKDWRVEVADHLEPHNIVGISPLRCEPIHGATYSPQYADPKFGTPRAIRAKNFYDVRNCDLVLAYFPERELGKEPSLGTISELEWAFALQKQSIMVTKDEFIWGHPVIDATVDWKLETLCEAVDVCAGLLAGYVGGKNV